MIIHKSKLNGKIKSNASKSYAHRALITAFLSNEECKVYIDNFSNDIKATIDSLKILGGDFNIFEDYVLVKPKQKIKKIPVIDAKESASTLRFILPIACSMYENCYFTAGESLKRRPLNELISVMEKNGVSFSSHKLPFKTKGIFKFENINIVGNISSQYITGLLFSMLLQKNKTEINITTKLESKSYVDISLDVLKYFGITISKEKNKYIFEPSEFYAKDFYVEGDFSNSAPFLCAAALNGDITVSNLNLKSLQSDRMIVEILKNYGAYVEENKNYIRVKSNLKRNINQDMSDIPDLLPILAVISSAVKGGFSRFYNAKRLRYKESDRIFSTSQMIKKLGGKTIEKDDELIVFGTDGLIGGEIDSFNDHRIVMASSICSVISKKDIVLHDENAIKKSYPYFFDDFYKLGGKFDSNIWK